MKHLIETDKLTWYMESKNLIHVEKVTVIGKLFGIYKDAIFHNCFRSDNQYIYVALHYSRWYSSKPRVECYCFLTKEDQQSTYDQIIALMKPPPTATAYCK